MSTSDALVHSGKLYSCLQWVRFLTNDVASRIYTAWETCSAASPRTGPCLQSARLLLLPSHVEFLTRRTNAGARGSKGRSYKTQIYYGFTGTAVAEHLLPFPFASASAQGYRFADNRSWWGVGWLKLLMRERLSECLVG